MTVIRVIAVILCH